MTDFAQLLLSPLGKEYCELYYVMMIFSLLNLVAGSIFIIKNIIESNKKEMVMKIVTGIFGESALIVQYILARLIYSICVKAL